MTFAENNHRGFIDWLTSGFLMLVRDRYHVSDMIWIRPWGHKTDVIFMQIACNLEIFMCVIDVLTQYLKTPFSAEPKLQYTHAPASVSNTSGKHVHAIHAPLNPTFIIMQNWRMHGYIRKTSPCKVYPLKPHFYIVKLGYAGVYLFFLFCSKT